MTKPTPNEYANYYDTYIKLTGDSPIIDQLEFQKTSTLNLLQNISCQKWSFAYAPGKWTVKELIQHIIDTEIVFAYRAFSIARGERQALPGFDQDEYVASAKKTPINFETLIETYEKTRAFSIAIFEYIKNCNLTETGIASGNQLSARAAGHIILGHELHHLRILEERYLNEQ